jgi:hypothetical protein
LEEDEGRGVLRGIGGGMRGEGERCSVYEEEEGCTRVDGGGVAWSKRRV